METTHDTRARSLRRAWCRAWEKARSLAATARVLLQAIYRRLGNDLFCWPSQATLAADAGISERSVRRWLPRLERAGWITRSKRITQRGQITDLIQIASPEQGVFSCPQGGQPGHPSPANLAAEKGSKEKASEVASEAAGAAAREGQGGLTKTAPTLGYVRKLLASWKELVKTSPPATEALSHYSAAELQTALAVLLVRMRRRVRSPKGLFLRILEATHCGEREPRTYSAAQLRQIAVGGLPEHARGVKRRQDHPMVQAPEEEPTSPADADALVSGVGAEPEPAKSVHVPNTYDSALATIPEGDWAQATPALLTHARAAGGALWDALMEAAQAVGRAWGEDVVATHMRLTASAGGAP